MTAGSQADWSGSWMLADETATEALGTALARVASEGGLVFLRGHLGAGKTTTARGLIRALGHSGNVKSPTYTLVEPYESLVPVVYHFDLYRLGDPEELEFMGFRDFLQSRALCLVEWPERGEGWLPGPDLDLELSSGVSAQGSGKGRQVRWRTTTAKGRAMAESFGQLLKAAEGITPAVAEKGSNDVK